jgi:hypothetical protein
MILRTMSRDRAPLIGSVPIYEKSQRKPHITRKIYILLINGLALKCKSVTNDNKNEYAIYIEIIICPAFSPRAKLK